MTGAVVVSGFTTDDDARTSRHPRACEPREQEYGGGPSRPMPRMTVVLRDWLEWIPA